jgi:hypothetical protein
VDAFDVQVEPDNLRLDLPEDMEVIVVAGGLGEQAAVH